MIGLVAVWSANAPILRSLVISPQGVTTLGSETFPDDPSLTTKHLDLRFRGSTTLEIASRHRMAGAVIDGTALMGEWVPVTAGQLVRFGDTLTVVADVARYAKCKPAKHYGLDVRISLRTPCEQLAQAILDETNVAIAGPRWVTHLLARGYLDARGGGVELDVSDRSRTLAAVLADASAKTVRLEAPNALLPTEYRTLRNWLETDVRFVSCIRRATDIAAVPAEIRRWLAPLVIEIPEPRFDELPVAIDAARRYYAPNVAITAKAVEDFLLGVRERDEDSMFHALADRLRSLVGSGGELAALRTNRARRDTFRMTSYPIDED